MNFFDLQEYLIFKENGLNAQESKLVSTPEEAYKIANTLQGDLIIKA